jgi:hypothetical protein
VTDGSGAASVVVKLSQVPMDNWVVIAQLDEGSLNKFRNVDANGDGAKVFAYDGGTKGLPIPGAQVAQPLVANRTLHVEVNSMGAEPAGFNFPADDATRGDLPDPDISAFRGAFSQMGIEVKRDTGKDSPATTWQHDFLNDRNGLAAYFVGAGGWRGSQSKEGYRIAYIASIYEDGAPERGVQVDADPKDNDADDEFGLLGSGDLLNGKWFSFVNEEVLQDMALEHGWNADDVQDVRQLVARTKLATSSLRASDTVMATQMESLEMSCGRLTAGSGLGTNPS